MTRLFIPIAIALALGTGLDAQNRYKDAGPAGRMRVALTQQPLGPNGP